MDSQDSGASSPWVAVSDGSGPEGGDLSKPLLGHQEQGGTSAEARPQSCFIPRGPVHATKEEILPVRFSPLPATQKAGATSFEELIHETNQSYNTIQERLRQIENANQFSWVLWLLAVLLPSILALALCITTVHLEMNDGQANMGIASANQQIQALAAAQSELSTDAQRLNRGLGQVEGQSQSLLTDFLKYKVHVTRDITEIQGRLNLNTALGASQKALESLETRLSEMDKKIKESEKKVVSVEMAQEATSSIKKQMGLLTAKVAATSSTAQTALNKADAGLSALEGVAFVKSRLHDCPPGSVVCTLWHWYKPDPFDPWCGGVAQQYDSTVDTADGRCFPDAASDWKNTMLGCCRV